MPKTDPPLANASGHADPGTAFAVLLKARGERRPTQVVFGPPADVAAAIAAGDARAASQSDVDISAPLHYQLPPADAPEPEAPAPAAEPNPNPEA